GATAVGELDQHTATITGVGAAFDPAARDQAVDAIGHGAAGHERLLEQRRGGELIRLTRAPEGGEHVEGPALDAVIGEARLAREVQLPGQTRDAGEDLHRRDVEIWTLVSPGCDYSVHFVHGSSLRPYQQSCRQRYVLTRHSLRLKGPSACWFGATGAFGNMVVLGCCIRQLTCRGKPPGSESEGIHVDLFEYQARDLFEKHG